MKSAFKRIAAVLVSLTAVASYMTVPLTRAGVTFELPRFTAFASSDTLTYNDFTYSIGDSGITITAYSGSDKAVVIPDSIYCRCKRF
ncbi:MAG: hypothetical protein E7497_08575 [Ruminococcus sp.]|nr:hypothetical protein [Ruminococcus sp.]